MKSKLTYVILFVLISALIGSNTFTITISGIDISQLENMTQEEIIDKVLNYLFLEALDTGRKPANPHSTECAPGIEVAQGYTDPAFIKFDLIRFPTSFEFKNPQETFSSWFKALHPIGITNVIISVAVDDKREKLIMEVGDPTFSQDVTSWTQLLMAASGVVSRVKFSPTDTFSIELTINFGGEGRVRNDGSGRFTFGFGVGVVEDIVLNNPLGVQKGKFFGAGCGMSVYGTQAVPDYECRLGGTGIGIRPLANNGILTPTDYGTGNFGIIVTQPYHVRLDYSSGVWYIQIDHSQGTSWEQFTFPITRDFRVAFGIGIQWFRPPPSCAQPSSLITGYTTGEVGKNGRSVDFILRGYGDEVTQVGYIASQSPLSLTGIPYDFTFSTIPFMGLGTVPGRGSNFLVPMECDLCEEEGYTFSCDVSSGISLCFLGASYDGRFLNGWTSVLGPESVWPELNAVLLSFGDGITKMTVYTPLTETEVRSIFGDAVDVFLPSVFVNNLGWGYDYAWMCGPLRIAPENLHPGCIGSQYEAEITASGGTLPYNWALISAPSGFTMGVIPPRRAKIFSNRNLTGTDDGALIIVQVTDSSFPPQVSEKTFVLRVFPPTPDRSGECNPYIAYIIDIRNLILAIDIESFRSSPEWLGERLRRALLNKLSSIEKALVSGGKEGEVMRLINDFRSKMDGCYGGVEQDDWIVDCSAQALLLEKIDLLINALEGGG